MPNVWIGAIRTRIKKRVCPTAAFAPLFAATMSGDAFKIIAIDGGAASGKSTTARALSTRLHYLHVDTGTHYRAITASLLEGGVDTGDADAVGNAVHAFGMSTHVHACSGDVEIDGNRFALEALRTSAVNEAVSHVAQVQEVRTFLLNYQRDQAIRAREAGFNGLVMDGRDIGTVVFPDADLKVFLVADEDARAERRKSDGERDSISHRDKIDSTRKVAPLKQPDDALVLDTGEMSVDAVVAAIMERLDTHG